MFKYWKFKGRANSNAAVHLISLHDSFLLLFCFILFLCSYFEIIWHFCSYMSWDFLHEFHSYLLCIVMRQIEWWTMKVHEAQRFDGKPTSFNAFIQWHNFIPLSCYQRDNALFYLMQFAYIHNDFNSRLICVWISS